MAIVNQKEDEKLILEIFISVIFHVHIELLLHTKYHKYGHRFQRHKYIPNQTFDYQPSLDLMYMQNSKHYYMGKHKFERHLLALDQAFDDQPLVRFYVHVELQTLLQRQTQVQMWLHTLLDI